MVMIVGGVLEFMMMGVVVQISGGIRDRDGIDVGVLVDIGIMTCMMVGGVTIELLDTFYVRVRQ